MRSRLLALLVPALLAVACTAQPSPPTATLTAPPSGAPTASALGTPTGTPALTGTPSAGPTTSPSDSASPSGSPSATTSAPPSASPSPASYDPQQLDARLAGALERLRQRYGIPGLSATVVMPDGHAWSAGSGFAALEDRRAARADTPFVVGSVTKTFVAALIVQLAAEGRLSLDDRLDRWLPDYAAHNDATLRQLLAHTSGIFNYFEHPDYNRRVFGEPEHAWTPKQIVREFAAPPYFAAGTGYHYSNTGFVLLGMVAETVTGRPLAIELRSRFFDPLGLADTHLQAEEPGPARAAHGYLVGRAGTPRRISDGTDYRPTTSAATVAWAAGAIVASAPDLATWARALYGGEVLDAPSLAQMTDFAANPYSGQAYGLGTRTRVIAGRSAVGHTGSLRGFAAAMWHFPAERISVVVLSNRGRVDVNPIAEVLGTLALDAVGYAP